MAFSTTETWKAIRDQMPITTRWAYFDHAAVAPLPAPVQNAVAEWADSMCQNGVADWSHWRKTVEVARKQSARLLNASREEIALVHSTTEGINLIAEGVPWQAGENVVTLDSEFPSNLYPWMNLKDRGVEVRQVPAERERVDLDRVAAACDARTRVLAVSWVGFATGWRNDLAAFAELAHRHGAKLFVDAIQGLGMFPLDVTDIPLDFLAADGHKWMLGPEGAGLLYIRREHLDWLRPLGVGWNSVEQAGDYSDSRLQLKRNAGRYEGGTYNMVGVAGFGAALEFLAESSSLAERSTRIGAIIEELAERLQRLGATIHSDRDPARKSGILAFTLPQSDPQLIKRKLFDQGIIVNCRQGRLRLSPHVYTNADDIEKLLTALSQEI